MHLFIFSYEQWQSHSISKDNFLARKVHKIQLKLFYKVFWECKQAQEFGTKLHLICISLFLDPKNGDFGRFSIWSKLSFACAMSPRIKSLSIIWSFLPGLYLQTIWLQTRWLAIRLRIRKIHIKKTLKAKMELWWQEIELKSATIQPHNP